MKTPLLVLVVLATFFVAGCQSATDSTPPSVGQTLTKSFVGLASGHSAWVEGSEDSLGQTRSLQVSLTLPATAELYVLYTNIAADSSVRNLGGVSGLTQRSVVTVPRVAAVPQEPVHQPRVELSSLRSLALEPVPASRSLVAASVSYKLNDTGTFADSLSATPTAANRHPMTLKRVLPDAAAGRTLYVWVVDDCWVGTDPKVASPRKVDQTIVDALAQKFLDPGTTQDVYGVVTNMLGKEWAEAGVAPRAKSGQPFIDGGAQIHIVIGDLNPEHHEYFGGGLMGYFHGWNNQPDPTSNQKVLFALDANTLANGDTDGIKSTVDLPGTPWSLGAYYPSEIVSTLAHEFQHMIHFYQRVVVQGSGEMDTWANEMASMAVEDLVADKIGVMGPRGLPGGSYVSYLPGDNPAKPVKSIWDGRLPLFNGLHDQVPLQGWPDWNSAVSPLPNYASAYAFGAWLTRNYGGPAFWKSLMNQPGLGMDAVVAAVNANGGAGQTYSSLVRHWGLSVLFGAGSTTPYAYSSADADKAFTFPAQGPGSLVYKTGSIDLRNYPTVYNDKRDQDPLAVYMGPAGYGRSPTSADTVGAGATWLSYVGSAGGNWSATFKLPPYIVVTVLAYAP